MVLSVSPSSGKDRAAVCDCGTPWTFFLASFYFLMFPFIKLCKLKICSVKIGLQSCHFFRERVANFLPSVHFVAALLYLSVFHFGFGGLMWIKLYQFLNSLIYFTKYE